jgi:hypothetical protein
MPRTVLTEAQIRHVEQTVMDYLDKNFSISNSELRALVGIAYDQAIHFFNRMITEGKLLRTGRGVKTRYVLPKRQ